MGRPGRPRKWPEPVMQAAIDAVVNGMAFKDAETMSGVPAGTIQTRMCRDGIVRRARARGGRRRYPYSVVRPALAAVARGTSVEDAAEHVGIAASTLRGRIREHGVVMLRPRKARETARVDGGIRPGTSRARRSSRTPASRRHERGLWSASVNAC